LHKEIKDFSLVILYVADTLSATYLQQVSATFQLPIY